jgi:POT family proton-dependent oligopeptide transporter
VPGVVSRSALVLLGTFVLMGLVLLSDRDGFTWLRWGFVLVPATAALVLSQSPDQDMRRLAAIAVFFIAAMVFWAIFEQAGVTIALFADTLTNRGAPGEEFPSAWFQSLNPLFVIMLAPLFAWAFMRLGPRQPSSPVKFVIGLIFLAASFALMVPAAMLTATGKISPLWLVGLFLLQTLGELFVSPVGLSLMTKLAPARSTGLILGLWFLAAALGNKLAGVLGGGFTASDPDGLSRFFLVQASTVAVASVVLLALVPWLKKQISAVR